MSVDKFGNVQPFRKYEYGLDDLENVSGFYEEGRTNKIYGLKLNANGIYTRGEISDKTGTAAYSLNDIENVEGFDSKGDPEVTYGFYLEKGIYKRIPINERDILDKSIKDKPVKLILREGDLKTLEWITLPLYIDWDIDFKLVSGKIITDGEDHIVQKLFNSGKMLVSLIPVYSNKIILRVLNGSYVLTNRGDNSTLEIQGEFKEETNSLNHLPNGSTILIEGCTGKTTDEWSNLLNGLRIKWDEKNKNTAFRIVVKIGESAYIVKSSIELSVDVDLKSVKLRFVYLNKNVSIKRIRYTHQDLTDDEIKYLDWSS